MSLGEYQKASDSGGKPVRQPNQKQRLENARPVAEGLPLAAIHAP